MNLKENILNIIYPNVCGICGKINEEYICKKCYIKIKDNLKCNIKKCGKEKYFQKHIYMCKYEGIIRKKIIDYKFNNQAYLYKMFAHIILQNKKICVRLKKYDIIIPVPIHKQREKQRGYNQSYLIAKELQKNIKEITINNNAIVKIKNIKPQSELSKLQREKNVKDAYKVKNIEKIIGKKILILDDIFTTGSTVGECSKKLIEAGCKTVDILTIAKD